MKNIQAKATILFSKDGMIVEVEDALSSEIIVRFETNQEQACQILSRLACVNVDAEVGDLSRVGKKMLVDKFVFPFNGRDKQKAAEKAAELCLQGKMLAEEWKPDLCFDYQDSFFKIDGSSFAQCTVRRWVDDDK